MPHSPRRYLSGGLLLAAVMVGGLLALLPHQTHPTSSRRQERSDAGRGDNHSPQPVATKKADPVVASPADPAIVAFHELSVDVPLIELAFRAGDPAALHSFPVQLGPNRFASVAVEKFRDLGEDEGVYSGTIDGQPDSQAVFSYVGEAYAGTVVLGAEQRAFYITATEDGQMRITELDLTKAPGCGQPLLAESEPPRNQLPDTPR